VAYLPDRSGHGDLLNKFSSMISAARILDYAGVYPVRTAPPMPGPEVAALLAGSHPGVVSSPCHGGTA